MPCVFIIVQTCIVRQVLFEVCVPSHLFSFCCLLLRQTNKINVVIICERLWRWSQGIWQSEGLMWAVDKLSHILRSIKQIDNSVKYSYYLWLQPCTSFSVLTCKPDDHVETWEELTYGITGGQGHTRVTWGSRVTMGHVTDSFYTWWLLPLCLIK